MRHRALYYVRVTRTDESVHFKGPMPCARAERERAASEEAEGAAGRLVLSAEILPVQVAKPEVRRWHRIVSRSGSRYYPEAVAV